MTEGSTSAQSADGIPSRLPTYDELPPAPRGGRSGWGVFGKSDSVGLVNLQTPARVADAARLVRTGQVFSLNAPLDALDPPLFRRGALEHTVIGDGRVAAFDDKLDNYFPQASSQWDSLAHVGYDADQFYNGATADDERQGPQHHRSLGQTGHRRRGPCSSTSSHLRGRRRGIRPGQPPGRDGRRPRAGPTGGRHRVAGRRRAAAPYRVPGLVPPSGHRHRSDWRSRANWPPSASNRARTWLVTCGTPICRRRWPTTRPSRCGPPISARKGCRSDSCIAMLIGQFGLAVGELWWLEDLARACREDGRFEVFLTAAPTNVNGGIGSSANALAIK